MVGRTTLRGIWMTESKLDVKPQALGRSDLALKHDLRVEVDEAEVDEDGALFGLIQFEASARLKRQRLIKVTAKYFVSYQVSGGCDQDTADMFLDRVARLAAYPYFRALVGSLLAQSGAQMPPLPIMSFQPRNIYYALDSKDRAGGAT